MKRMVAIVIVMVMLFSVSKTAYASSQFAQNGMNVYYNTEYDFSVNEYVSSDNKVIRTYQPKLSSNESPVGYKAESEYIDENEVKAILSAVGMDDDFIVNLSNEDLESYARSKGIISIAVYVKRDDEGNIEYVTEKEAQESASTRGLVLPPHEWEDGSGGGDDYTYKDEYMKILYVVSYYGSGRYRFSVDATWLTDPTWRQTDSLGACSQNVTVENGTRSGWYSYTKRAETGTSFTDTELRDTLTDFSNAVSGNWYGSAVRFDLHDNSSYITNAVGKSISTGIVTYTNHKIHYQFEGYVTQPSIEAYFNTVATYEHVRTSYLPDLSIGISASGISASIGLSAVVTKDTRTAEFDSSIHYVPD